MGPKTVARLLKDHDYSLQANTKTIEGKQHPDCDAQFSYINEQVTAFLAAGHPVISVDTKTCVPQLWVVLDTWIM